MPIQTFLNLDSVSDEEFAETDAIVMHCAYASHNHFGRLFDERVYENDVAARLRAEGLTVYTQVPISVSYDGFEKVYYLDLVVDGILYELKVVKSLSGEHSAQALNYAMLNDVRLIKLLNFGAEKVQGKLLRNALYKTDRQSSTTKLCDWRPMSLRCDALLSFGECLVKDWGTHLHAQLYNQAFVHRFCGDLSCESRINLYDENLKLGSHPVQLYDKGRAFFVTGFNKDQTSFQRHLELLLHYATELDSIQWLNFNHTCLEAKTLVSPRQKHAID